MNDNNEDKKRKWERSEDTNLAEKKKFSDKSNVSGGGSKFSNKATSSGSYSKNRPETSQGKNSNDKESRSICAYCGVIGHATTLCQRSENIYRNSVMTTPYLDSAAWKKYLKDYPNILEYTQYPRIPKTKDIEHHDSKYPNKKVEATSSSNLKLPYHKPNDNKGGKPSGKKKKFESVLILWIVFVLRTIHTCPKSTTCSL